jgi:type II secretion system protein N
MTLRHLSAGIAIAAVFVGVLMLTFPSDAIVRYALARLTLPRGMSLVFERAHLRPWGLRLERPSLLQPDGSPLASADWVIVRPSLRGLLRDRTGRPWLATAAACGGLLEAVVDRDATGDVATLGLKDVDLGSCPPLALARERVAGRAEGRARVRITSAAVEGELTLHDASWRGAGLIVPGVAVLHGDPASVRWTLGEGRLTLAAIELHGPEIRMTGAGTVRLAEPVGGSALDLTLAVAPGPDAPPLLVDLIGRLPPADDGPARRLVVSGTVDAPALPGSP